MAHMPLYKIVMQEIENKIANGDWIPGGKLPTEIELEQIYNVSNITIRHALKGLVDKGLISRVRGGGSYVQELPVSRTSTEGQYTKRVIGLLMPVNRNNGDMMDIVCGISHYCFERGYLLNINNYSDQTIQEGDFLNRLAEKSAGIVYYPMNAQHSFECLYTLNCRHYPLVTLDQRVTDLDIPYVTSDNQAGAYEATQLLLKKGHRHICFVSTGTFATTVRDRFVGFCQALEEGGVSVNSNNYITNCPKALGGKAEEHDWLLSHLLDRPEPVTAVLAINDYVAYELIQAARRRNVQVPKDLSVIGFDNLPFIEQMKLPLTTVAQDLYTMGEKAAQLLIDYIEGRPTISITVPVRLICRNSICVLESESCGFANGQEKNTPTNEQEEAV